MITIQLESLTREILDEMDSLMDAHWEEVAVNQQKIKLKVDKDWYVLMQENGLYVYISVRDDGKLVGYLGYMLQAHPHYMDNIFASMDVVFIDKAYRKGMLAVKLFKVAEQELKDLGVDVIYNRMKKLHPLTSLFERLGYEEGEVAFIKYVGEQ